MSDLTLLVLRLGFLALLWVFVFAIVYALRSDLFGHKARKLPQNEVPSPSPFPAASAAPPAAAPTPSPSPAPAPAAPLDVATEAMAMPGSAATRLVITSGSRTGQQIELGSEQLTIGRSSESGLVIRDDYTSTHHARLMLWNNEWMVQDLDSTNGTFLAGNRVTVPTRVPLNTPIKIGTTTFELRR